MAESTTSFIFWFKDHFLDLKRICSFFKISIVIFLFSSQILPEERTTEQSSSFQRDSDAIDIPFYTMENERTTLYEGLGGMDSGKLLLLNYTSSFCKPCKYEIPELLKIQESNPKIVLWLIFVGDEPEAIYKKVAELKIPKNVIILKDPLETSLKRMKISSLPITLVIRKDRKVSAYSIGYDAKKFLEFKSKINDILKN